MEAHKTLENYISTHPNYWEFEDEVAEVAKLKEACKQLNLKQENNSSSRKTA